MNTRHVRVLYDYNRWCNARILDAAAGLTADQFLGPGRFPHGGVRGTLVHTLFAEWAWRMRWQGTPPRDPTPLRPDEFPTLAALHARWKAEDALLRDFVDGLTDQRLTSMLEYSSTEGGRHTRVLWETMVHLVNHGTQHRAEAAAMLTDLGHSPGDIDLIVYLNENRG